MPVVNSNCNREKDVVIDQYKKIRKQSKNIELSQANHLFQINETLLGTGEKEKKDEKKIVKKYLFANPNEEHKRSCINIFSSSITHATRDGGTISLCNSNSSIFNNHIGNLMPTFATNKGQCKLNIDFLSLSKINLKTKHSNHRVIKG